MANPKKIEFPKINPNNLKETLKKTLKAYNKFSMPDDFAEVQIAFKLHWDTLHALVKTQPLQWRKDNEELIHEVVVKQHFLSLKFEDAERELLDETIDLQEKNNQKAMNSNLSYTAPEFFPKDFYQSTSNLAETSQTVNCSGVNVEQGSANNSAETPQNAITGQPTIEDNAAQPVDQSDTNDSNNQSLQGNNDHRMEVDKSVVPDKTTIASIVSPMVVDTSASAQPTTVETRSTITTTNSSGLPDMRTCSSSIMPPMDQVPTRTRYSIKALDMANEVFDIIADLPVIPINAKPSHFRALRNAISDALDRARQNDMPFDMYVPYLLAKAQAALGPEFVMPFRYGHLITGATLEELRDFLAQNEHFLQDGVDIRPQCSRWPSSHPSQSIPSQRVAVKSAAANLRLPGQSASRRSRSLEPKSKKKKNISHPCYRCKSGEHKTFKCSQYLVLSYRDRCQFVSSNGICENCVDGKHATSACTKKGCDQCHTKHNRTLCPLLVHNTH